MSNKQESKQLTLTESFRKYFSIEVADSSAMKQKIYHIRYRVYCKEFEYEAVENCPDEMETDEYDDQSLHCLITHKNSQIPAACVRLVPASIQGHDVSLPFEKYCGKSIDHHFIEQLALDRNTECEISRLAVDGIFRKRSGEEVTRFGALNTEFSTEERRTFLMIAVAAFLGATVLTELSGRTNVFAMMEPFLPRLLKRSGIIFQRAGEDIDYHGVRAPYFITTQSALKTMRPDLLELYRWIYQQISHSFNNTSTSPLFLSS